MEKEVILLGGLGYGDEGKGTIVDYLVRLKEAKVVVRYNGGAQAGHNVVSPDGLSHTFSQFGSGTLLPGVKTHLSRFMVLNPFGMIKEEEHLQSLGIKDAFSRTTIDGQALVTTPFQIAVNRLLEIHRGDKRHGSCGIGVGQTIEDFQKYGEKVLFAKDLADRAITAKKLKFLQGQSREAVQNVIRDLAKTDLVKNELAWLEDKEAADDIARHFCFFTTLVKIADGDHLAELIKNNSVVVFEGAQGVLLDKYSGFWPHVTKTNTTFENALKLLAEANYREKITKVGVLRAYGTRHGAGPFPGEDAELTGILKDEHNTQNLWQGGFRVGWLDVNLTRFAIMRNRSLNYIALTNVDRLVKLGVVKARLDSTLVKFSGWQEYVSFLESKEGLYCPIKILSFGPTWKEKIFR